MHEHSPMRTEVSTLHENITKNGDGANDRRYIDPIRNGDALDTTGYCHPPIDGKETGQVP